MASSLNLTDNGVRYLVQKGIVEPDYDEGNGYGFFDTDDASWLHMYKMYRDAGFSLSQAKELMAIPPAQAVPVIAAHVERMRSRHERLERCAQGLMASCELLADGPAYSICRRPALVYMPIENGSVYDGSADKTINVLESVEQRFHAWLEYAPDVAFGAIALRGATRDGRPLYVRSLMATAHDVERLGLPLFGGEVTFPERGNCLKAVVEYEAAEGEEGVIDSVLAWMDEHRFQAVADEVTLRFLHMNALGERIMYQAVVGVPIAGPGLDPQVA